jgi:hypothetical protein
VVAASLLALALLPAAAHSQAFVGESDQGFPVRAVMHGRTIDRIKVKWSAPCPETGYLWGPEATMWFNREPAPFKVAGRRYSDHGTNRFPFRGGHGVMRQRLSGRFSANSVTGVQTSAVRVYDKDGKKLDSCSSKISFRASPKQPLP